MKKTGITAWSCILLIAISLLVPSVPKVLGQNYIPGAQKGQWVYYGQISASFQTNVINPYPSGYYYIHPFINVSSINSTVTDVTQDKMTLSQVWSFNNGTSPRVINDQGNVTSGIFQPSIAFVLWFIAGGLSAGETVFRLASGPINDTIVANYAGSLRAVNVVSCGCNVPGGQGEARSEAWDRTSGLLLEQSYSIYTLNYGNYQNGTLDIKATQTNIPTTNPDFTITSSSSTVWILPNITSTTRLTLTAPDRLTISLAISVAPTGIQCSLNPNTVKVLVVPTNSTLSCIGPLGTYRVMINATSGLVSHPQAIIYKIVSSLPATVFGLDPTTFFVIVGVVAVAVFSLTILTLNTMKKHRQQNKPPPFPTIPG